jgi:hypothetical protein
MDGVTTAIVAFVLACLIFPHVIKNKPQYYGAVGCVLLIILFGALARMINAGGFTTFAIVMMSLLQIGAIFLLILSAGGLTVKDLAGELADTIEVVRRGDQNKEIIVPLRGEMPGAGRANREAMRESEREGPGRIVLDTPAPPPPPEPVRRDEEDDRGGIPLA